MTSNTSPEAMAARELLRRREARSQAAVAKLPIIIIRREDDPDAEPTVVRMAFPLDHLHRSPQPDL